MKAYSKYMALAAVAVSFAACQQEEMDITSQDDLVRIEATIGELPQTRVTYFGNEGTTTFDKYDEIRVVNTKRESKNAAIYKYVDVNAILIWKITDGSLVWNGGTTANNQFNAYYPVSAAYDKFTLGDQTGGVEGYDWMTATTDEMTKQQTLDLRFNHRLTKVTVSVTDWGDEIAEANQKLTSAQIYTPTVITWNETTTAGSDNKWITSYMSYDGDNFTVIICPGDPATDGESSNAWLKVTAADGNTYNVKPISGTTFEAGKHYKFNLKVGKDKMTIASVTVAEWGTTTSLGKVYTDSESE